MKNFSMLILAIFLAGCSILAKPAPQMQYFMLGEAGFQSCENESEKTKTAVFIEQTRALDAFDSRNIIIVGNDAKISAFESAKWITAPSDMIYKSILSAVSKDCSLKASFDKRNLTLKTNLLLLQSSEKQAQIALGYTILKGRDITKSGVISSSKPTSGQTPQDIVSALNSALNELLAQILEELNKGNR